MADPLAAALRLRRLALAEARRERAEAGRLRHAADLAEAAAGARLVSERAGAEGADYAAWLPRGFAERASAQRDARRAEAAEALALGQLAAARVEERAVAELLEARDARRRAARERAERLNLDEAMLRGPR